ncbi:MAG: DUF2306 domain-containing protein [Saprospiraceae bacterium]|nr:DUF2306 domain-containing protein [Saprospiraceae bacterium]
MGKIRWYLFAALSLCIGIYPIVYLLVDPSFGLISTKSTGLWEQPFYRLAFFSHILFGGLTLLTGWSQFSDRWRKRHLSLHRLLGKVYLLAMLPSALAGIYLSFYATGGLVAGLGFFLLGIVWLFSSLAAYGSIRNGDVDRHAYWMVFSYAACFAAVTLRLWLPLLTALFELAFVPAYQIVAWLCWVPNLLFAWFYTARRT